MMEEEKLAQTYWPQTTVPYGEDTAFQAARIYAGAITGWQDIIGNKNVLLRRAAELLRDNPSKSAVHPAWAEAWNERRDQWLKDAGVEK